MKHGLSVRSVLFLVGCVLFLTACIMPPSKPTAPAGGANPLAGTKWQLVTLSQQQALATAAVTIEFTDDALSGSAGCNTYSATYRLNETTITLSPAAATLMACADEQQMAQENSYFEALGNVTQAQIVGEQLELRNGQGEVVMLFAKQ